MLPQNLCALTDGTLWTCSHCEHSEDERQVALAIQRTGEELSTLASRPVADTVAFLNSLSIRYHKNHYYQTEVRLALCQRLGQETPRGVQALTDDQLALKINLCRHLLQLLSVIAPGKSYFKELWSSHRILRICIDYPLFSLLTCDYIFYCFCSRGPRPGLYKL